MMNKENVFEVVVKGSHAAGMAQFLIDKGALFLRKDPPNNYVFVHNSVFDDVLAELQISIRQGFFLMKKGDEHQ